MAVEVAFTVASAIAWRAELVIGRSSSVARHRSLVSNSADPSISAPEVTAHTSWRGT